MSKVQVVRRSSRSDVETWATRYNGEFDVSFLRNGEALTVAEGDAGVFIEHTRGSKHVVYIKRGCWAVRVGNSNPVEYEDKAFMDEFIPASGTPIVKISEEIDRLTDLINLRGDEEQAVKHTSNTGVMVFTRAGLEAAKRFIEDAS
jgi:hypothetical protein